MPGMEEMVSNAWKQVPLLMGLLVVLAAPLWGMWRMMVQAFDRHEAAVTTIVKEHREALQELGRTCHAAHSENAERQQEHAEQITARCEHHFVKSAEMASHLHNILGQVGVHLKRCAESSERLERATVKG